MDVAEFITKAGYKILSLTYDFTDELHEKGESDIWREVYLLSEAIKVLNSDITTAECAEKIVNKLNDRCGLSSITEPSTGGLGEMSLDGTRDCNVFEVGSEAGVCDLVAGESIVNGVSVGGGVIEYISASAEVFNSVGDISYVWKMYNADTDSLILSRVGLISTWQWNTATYPNIYIRLEITDDICTFITIPTVYTRS